MKRVIAFCSLFICFSSFAEPQCRSFTVVNNTGKLMHVAQDPSADMFCNEPNSAFFKPGESWIFSVRKYDNEKNHPTYISFRGMSLETQYNLFAQFFVDEDDQRAVREELLSPYSAYSWNKENSKIYLCTNEQYQAHGTCDFG